MLLGAKGRAKKVLFLDFFYIDDFGDEASEFSSKSGSDQGMVEVACWYVLKKSFQPRWLSMRERTDWSSFIMSGWLSRRRKAGGSTCSQMSSSSQMRSSSSSISMMMSLAFPSGGGSTSMSHFVPFGPLVSMSLAKNSQRWLMMWGSPMM